jgi:hypothetical protein
MPRPRFCRNRECPYAWEHPPDWLVRAGTYHTAAHGQVRRYVCKRFGPLPTQFALADLAFADQQG